MLSIAGWRDKLGGMLWGSVLLLSLYPFLQATPAVAQTTSLVEGTISNVNGLPITGAEITLGDRARTIQRTAVTNTSGFYQIPALAPGTYLLAVAHTGFKAQSLAFELTLNHTLRLDLVLEIGQIQGEVTIRFDARGLETDTAAVGRIITRQQTQEMPLNGRNYLDLLQLVPGVAVNRGADHGSDTAVPVLGERAGNTGFLLDGFANQDTFGGGAAVQLNQDTIVEFQVLTTGYKAEFGYASGGIVNAISQNGTNDWHQAFSLFHRNEALDQTNVLGTTKPPLRRWNYSLTSGGPILKDRVFFFGSGERIKERRQLNFTFPAVTPQVLRDFESRFNQTTRDLETRAFLRLDEQLGRHQLVQQVSWANSFLTDFLPLSKATNLPSTRQDKASRNLMLGFGDTGLLGSRSDPFVLALRGQYYDEPATVRPSHPQAGPQTAFEMFSNSASGRFFGDLGQVIFGSSLTPSTLHQNKFSLSVSLAKDDARNHVKAGWSFTRTRVDGIEANLLFNQLFATLPDFAAFGPTSSGLFTLRSRGGDKPEENLIRLRNHYNGLFFQNDLKVRKHFNLNLGVRWDYDSEFPTTRNFSPRLGFAWGVSHKLVVRGSWGIFYDHFRLGLVRDIPSFGGANIRNIQPVSYPRLFYGVPTIAPIVFGLCLSPTLTDSQITSNGTTCMLGPLPLIGVDRLNNVVAPGHAPIPANAVVMLNNVQALTGFTPQQFADQGSVAIGRAPGFFFWGPFGALTHTGSAASAFPVTLDQNFRTPFARSLSLSLQREVSKNVIVNVDFYHKGIRNIAGMRLTNVPFDARLPGRERNFNPPSTQQEVRGFGSWFTGTYNAVSIGLSRRFSPRLTFEGSYTYAHAIDNTRCANLVTGLVLCAPSDSFVGVPPVVVEQATGSTNASGPFIASNGNPVPQAGVFYNGPDLDLGPSDLALNHTFLAHGTVELPWRLRLSAIFRTQSGFHFSRLAPVPVDVDGDLNFNDLDHTAGRNTFSAPPLINLDVRLSTDFKVSERVRITPLIEFFNLANRRNPAAVEAGEGRPTSFGQPLQVLPGREGQIGLRIEF